MLIASRSAAVLERARARARAALANDGQQRPALADASLRVVSQQQDWLAAAMGAVHAEEVRAGKPVNVQLDWLAEAVTQMGSFDESSPESSPMGSRARCSRKTAGAMPSQRDVTASQQELETHVARLQPKGSPSNGVEPDDVDREALLGV